MSNSTFWESLNWFRIRVWTQIFFKKLFGWFPWWLSYPSQASLVAQLVKNLPAMQETWVRYLTWEDLLEKGMATHSTILAWWIPWAEEPGRLYSPWGRRVGQGWVTSLSLSLSLLYIYEESNQELKALVVVNYHRKTKYHSLYPCY